MCGVVTFIISEVEAGCTSFILSKIHNETVSPMGIAFQQIHSIIALFYPQILPKSHKFRVRLTITFVQEIVSIVIPANAGIQFSVNLPGPRLRGSNVTAKSPCVFDSRLRHQ
jgi:hypothetical protein